MIYLQFAIYTVIFGVASTLLSAAVFAPVSTPQEPAETKDADDDDDDWVFDSGMYSNSPKTGERVWQYAKEKPVYTNTPSYSNAPRYYSSDPFFLPSTDMMFFQNNPDPFYAEPTSYPSASNGTLRYQPYFYGLKIGGYDPNAFNSYN